MKKLLALGLLSIAMATSNAVDARYLQTDPIGYEDNVNLYAYVGNEPIGKIDPSGESDLNLFAPDDNLFQAGEDFEPNNSSPLFTITGHGSARGVRDSRRNGSGQILTPRNLVGLATQNGYSKGSTIFLASCNCAGGDYAQQVSDKSGGNVIAADGFVFFPSTAKGHKAGSSVNLTVNSQRDGKGEARSFRLFSPGGNGRSVRFSSARYNAKTGKVTLRFGTNTKTRQANRVSVCANPELCGKKTKD